jgi:NitT/TauT family transport system permease protein
MTEDDRASQALRFVAPAIVALVVIGLWQVLTTAFEVPSYIVPSPSVVLQTLVADRELLLRSLGVTLGIALAALAIAVVAGTLAALLFVQSR